MYQSTIFGTSVQPRSTAEGPPHCRPGDQLERPREISARLGDADDDLWPQPLWRAFERLTHDLDVAVHSKL